MGGDSGTIIVRNLKAAAGMSITSSGKFKVWHALVVTHALAALAGWLL